LFSLAKVNPTATVDGITITYPVALTSNNDGFQVGFVDLQ